MQLERLLQKHGFGTRKACRALIRHERVAVNGALCNDPFAEIATAGLIFAVDGVDWPYAEFASLVLHKPAGYECSRKPQHHPSVLELLPLPLRERGVQPIGRLDADGYLWYVGRSAAKELIKPGGENVYPAEVEQVLSRVDGVAEVAVIGVPDDRLGEVGRAFVTPRPGAAVDADAVLAHAREHLANFKVPRSVVVVESFPRNASGKILKRELT